MVVSYSFNKCNLGIQFHSPLLPKYFHNLYSTNGPNMLNFGSEKWLGSLPVQHLYKSTVV